MNDLLDKLKALGLKVEKAVDIEPASDSKISIDQVMQGNWVNEISRGVYIVEKDLPLGMSYGAVSLYPPENFGLLTQFADIKKEIYPKDLLFIDTETSSLSTGAGSFAFLVGLSYFFEDKLKVMQIFLETPDKELEFLSCLDDILAGFTTFVSYNGKSFDIPLLRNRFILNKLSVPVNQFEHIDLLHIARRIWKLRLDSRKLSDIEQEILSLTRSSDEIPGWLVPQIYFDYLETEDASPLKGVFYHNEMDVISLAALLIHINQLMLKQPSSGSVDSRDIYSIGYTLGKMGLWDLSEDFYKAGMERGLPEHLQSEAARNFALALKKQRKWTEAVHYWEFAAKLGDSISCVELAKYYEHYEKSPKMALQWVEEALQIANGQNIECSSLTHRKARLQKKSEMNHER